MTQGNGAEAVEEVREAVREFVVREVVPVAGDLDRRNEEIPMGIIRKMADLGYLSWWRGPALGSLDEFFAKYEKVSAIPVRPESVHYYVVFGLLFGLGISVLVRRKLCQGVLEDPISGLLMGVFTTEQLSSMAYAELARL